LSFQALLIKGVILLCLYPIMQKGRFSNPSQSIQPPCQPIIPGHPQAYNGN
jgi:hypothetical protein